MSSLDWQPEPTEEALSPGALEALRTALREHLRADAGYEEVQRALREVAEEAHTKQLAPERLLIAFKQVLSDLPEARLLPPGEREERLARLVTLCIDEYYREP